MNLSLFIASFNELLAGAGVSLLIAGGAALIGMSGALLLSVLQESRSASVRRLVDGYIALFRGTPMLLQITILFYALPQVGLSLPAIAAAILAMGCNSAAYMSGVLSSGLRSIPKEQLQTAIVLGMNPLTIFLHVRWPHIWRTVLPTMTNEWTTLIKDSSLASVIGVTELAKVGALIRGRTYDAWTSLLGVGLFYLVMTWACSLLCQRIQKRGAVPCSL